ncbi:MGMT family protein, partial [Synechococcus sp. R55.2]
MASPTNRKGGVAQKVGVILQPGKESLPFRAGSDVEKSCQAEPKSVSLYQRFYEVVRRIPPGRVATYGQVARAAGYPGYARQVGYALFRLQGQNTDIPWQRVINAQGCISYSPFRLGY